MLTNERIVLVVVGSITCVHWLALLWDIWMTIWLEDYTVAYHELYARLLLRLCVIELIRVFIYLVSYLLIDYLIVLFNSHTIFLVLQTGRTAKQCSAALLSAVFEGVKRPSNDGSSFLNLTPASQQLASKLLELAFDLGLEVNCF